MKNNGFTLAELLIALAILGVIATFTIPKVLNSQRNQAWNSGAKEAISMISGAYQAYKLNNTPTAATGPEHLTPYMNYVSLSSTATFDGPPGEGVYGCNTGTCMYLHNGGMLYYAPFWDTFGGTHSTNFFGFAYDPDGKATGDTLGNGSLMIELYYNGKIVLNENVKATDETATGGTPQPGLAWATTPSWFSWN